MIKMNIPVFATIKHKGFVTIPKTNINLYKKKIIKIYLIIYQAMDL